MITTNEAARRLGVGPRRLRYLIAGGRLKAQKIGRDWLVEEASVDAFVRLKSGPKPKGGGDNAN